MVSASRAYWGDGRVEAQHGSGGRQRGDAGASPQAAHDDRRGRGYVDVPGKFLTSACDDFGTVFICYAGMQGQADHFVMAPPGGGEFTVRSVPFRGDSFVAFAVPAGEQTGVLTAYDHRGRSMDSTSLS
jgi:hypothetical protein